MANGIESKACYRFVPINSKVVPGPLSFEEISHTRPLPECWSGSLTVEWKNETPICVGMPVDDNGEKVDFPFHLPGKRFALPGPSLKGMIRSVLEIATFSHLGRVNDQHHFGYRDFDNNYYKRLINPKKLYAGWLSYDDEDQVWQFATAGCGKGFALLPIDTLADLGIAKEEEIFDRKMIKKITMAANVAWKRKKANKKRQAVNREGFGPGVIHYTTADKDGTYDLDIVKDIYKGRNEQTYAGVIVCANGVGGKKQRYEAVFNKPNNSVKISPDYIKRFALLHSKRSKNKMEPEGNWFDWLKEMGYPDPLSSNSSRHKNKTTELPGIPVYYCGTPPTEGQEDTGEFFMGFSRVIKIPYQYSVGDVAKRTVGQSGPNKYSISQLTEKIDGSSSLAVEFD